MLKEGSLPAKDSVAGIRPLRHDIVNILYIIRGLVETHLEVVKEERFQSLEQRSRHAENVLERIYAQAGRALEIARRLGCLLKSKGALRENRSPVSLGEAWQEALSILTKEFPLKGVEVVERIPENFPEVGCEKNELVEIFYHLAHNALQAMEGRGKLIFRAQLAFSLQEEPYAVITFADTGPGIAEGELPYLFHPFFTTKPQEYGNGLGLYLTKALVSRNRGKIAVSSYPGAGTTFTLEFPVQK